MRKPTLNIASKLNQLNEMLFDHTYIYLYLYLYDLECQIGLKNQVGHDFRAQGYTIFE